jgi:hypothetical protein
MSEAAPAAGERAAGGVRRVRAAWRALAPEQRLVAFAALGLLLTMFLPWYSTTSPGKLGKRIVAVHDTQSAIGAFSWVEAAVLLVALGVLTLLFARGERRAFHLPGGDGAVITGAGVWACVLIVWRFFDKPELGTGVSVGLEWGIFVALAAAVGLALAGNRVRAAHRPEPPLAQAESRPPPPGAPVAVRIPDERPHLEETRVMADRSPQTPAARRPGPVPLSRETAAQDTAEFRAVPDAASSEPDRGDTEEGRTEPLPSEEDTRALPSEDETQRLPRSDDDDDDPPRLPGLGE